MQRNSYRQTSRRDLLRLLAGGAVGLPWLGRGIPAPAEEVLPKHITAGTLKAVRSGLDYLARTPGRRRQLARTTRAARPIRWPITGLAGTALLGQRQHAHPRPLCAASRSSAIEYLLELLDAVGPDHRARRRTTASRCTGTASR